MASVFDDPPQVEDYERTFSMMAESHGFEWIGLFDGDVAVMYRTRDVTPEDIAAVEINGGCWLGHYRPAPGGYFSFERDGETDWFKPGTAVLLGRVCHFERKGEVVRQFRPIR